MNTRKEQIELAEDLLKILKIRTDSQIDEAKKGLEDKIETLEKRVEVLEEETTKQTRERVELNDLLDGINEEEPNDH